MIMESEISELEAIIHNYTTFFLVFDCIFFVMLFLGLIFAIRFIKSKRNLQSSNEYLRYTIHGQEAERARIARELHDTVAQDLRYCKNLLEKKNAIENLSQITELLGKSLSEVRMMSYNLAPPQITKKDFSASVVNLCSEFAEKSGLDFRLSVPDGTDCSFLDEDDILNLYRIVQEALTNIIKHAAASEVVILIRNQTGEEEKGLYIFISDDGQGFDPQKKSFDDSKHFGLTGMKKRSQLIGAKFLVNSAKGEGTQISIFLPEKKTTIHREVKGVSS